MRGERRIEYLQAIGIDLWIPRRANDPTLAPPAAVAATPVPAATPAPAAMPAPAAAAPAGAVTAPPAEMTDAQIAARWDALRSEVENCKRCPLHATRTQGVLGVGPRRADWLVIGEAPGAEEDRRGEPFVGRAGELLTRIIKAMDDARLIDGVPLTRDTVYICNVLKCRPPENRNPEPDEVASCEPFLKKQIELVRPEIIVALGKFAVQTLLQTKAPITKLRGRWHGYHGIKLMPTFHPAYLLRNPADKKLVWEDIKKVIKEMHGESA